MKFSLFTLFIVFGLLANAQQSMSDSLRRQIYLSESDTQKVNRINAYTRYLIITSEFDSAMYYNQMSFEIAQSASYKRGLAINHTYFGLVYYAWGNYPETLKHYYSTLKLREELHDKAGVAATYHNIGNMYYAQGNAEEAMRNFKASLKIKTETGDTLDSHYAHTINNLGNFYENKVDFPEAMQYYERAAAIEARIGDVQGLISAYGNMANVYIYLQQYDKAFVNYARIMKLSDSIGDKQNLAAIYNDLGNLYYKINKPQEAITWLNKGIIMAEEVRSMDDLRAGYGYRTDVHAVLGNFKEALHDYKMYVAYRDSLNNEESTKKMVRSEMNYGFEKREAAAKLEQEKKEAIAEAEKRKQRIILFAISGFGLLVLGFAIFAYRSYLQKQKANLEITLQKEVIEEKQKAIVDSILYAKRIQTALLTSEIYIERNIRKLKGV